MHPSTSCRAAAESKFSGSPSDGPPMGLLRPWIGAPMPRPLDFTQSSRAGGGTGSKETSAS